VYFFEAWKAKWLGSTVDLGPNETLAAAGKRNSCKISPWGNLSIARKIQKSPAGKRKGGVLPYSISAILKDIRQR